MRSPLVPTNIVIIETEAAAEDVAGKLARDGVLVSVMGGQTIRCVTHLGIDAVDARRAAEVIATLLAA